MLAPTFAAWYNRIVRDWLQYVKMERGEKMKLTEFMTVKELAQRLGVCKLTAYGLVNGGVIPSIRAGKKILIPFDGFQQWIRRESGAHATNENDPRSGEAYPGD